MTIEATDSKKTGSCFRSGLLYGCLPVLILAALVSVVLWSFARAGLEARFSGLQKSLEAFYEEQSEARSVFFGPPSPGNAVEEYWLINDVLGPPPTWDTKASGDGCVEQIFIQPR